MQGDLSPLPGPTRRTPPRRPDSIRRTISIEMVRPSGESGPLLVHAQGRDLRTEESGDPVEVREAKVDVRVTPDGRIETLIAPSGFPTLDKLVGGDASSGFRKRLVAAAGDHEGELIYSLLDELPIGLLLSSAPLAIQSVSVPERLTPPADVCAGWVRDGWLSRSVAIGQTPRDRAVLAPHLEDGADVAAWHPMAVLQPRSVRRIRRLDLFQGEEGRIGIDCWFRDALVDDNGGWLVLHEYEVDAAADARSLEVLALKVTPRVLPGPQCPNALMSAQRLVGCPLDALRPLVTADFSGTTTCTHLNDALRALGDVHLLVSDL